MQVVNAFSFVQNSLSFIINAYTEIAAWQAVTQRLSGFEQQLLAFHQSKRAVRRINIGLGVLALLSKRSISICRMARPYCVTLRSPRLVAKRC
jgi:hypothetical protein